MKKNTKMEKIRAAMLSLPRCAKCNQILLSSADRSKPVEDVEWAGVSSSRMPMHPRIAPKKGDLCYFHEMEEQKQRNAEPEPETEVEKLQKKLKKITTFNSQTKNGKAYEKKKEKA